MSVNRFRPKDPRSPDRVMAGTHGARKRKNTQDEDGVDQVKEEGDGKFR